MKQLPALCLLLFILVACDSAETKKQRFLIKGNEQLAKRNFATAVFNFQEALKIDSCFSEALNNIGTAYFEEKKYAEALQFYNSAIACHNFLPAYFNRINTLYELRQYDLALVDIQAVKQLKPDTISVYFAEGLVSTQQRRFADAEVAFRKALTYDSLNSELLVNLGTILYYQRNLEAAVRQLNRAVYANPDEADAYNTLAMIAIQQDNLEEADRWIQRALAIRPHDAYFINNRGYIRFRRGQMNEAVEDFNSSIAADPYNAWAYRNKGLYYLAMKDYPSAVRLLEQAAKMDPFVEEVYSYLCEAYLQNKQYDKACAAYNQAIRNGERGEVSMKPCK
jgi:tetratricopeptide (TPR) repeat protein